MASLKITTALGIVVAAAIALGIGVGVTYVNLSNTTSQPRGSSLSRMTSETSTTTFSKPASPPLTYYTQTVATNSSYPCSTFYERGAARTTIFSIGPANSTLLLCVKFYYFDFSTVQTFQSADQLQIQDKAPSPSGFVLSSQPSSFTIGGLSNQSEGILVIYQISSSSESNGTWLLNFGWMTDNATGSPEFVNCDTEYGLMVGTGQPSYFPSDSMCTSFASATTFPTDHLFAEVIGSGTLGK